MLFPFSFLQSQVTTDPDALAFFARVTAAGGTLSATEKTAVNTLVIDLKANSLWTLQKAIYPMVGASAAACAQNLKSSSFTGTFTSGWTFASTGVKANGTSAYFDSTLTPSTSLTVSNLHLSAYSRTTFSPAGDTNIWGAYNPGNFVFGDFYNATPRFYTTNGGTAYIDTPFSNTRGLIVTSITSNATNDQKTYQNATLKGQNTNTSIILPTAKIYFNAANNSNVSAVNFAPFELSWASIGDGINSTQENNLYTAVQAFQTTLSRQV